MFIYTIGLGYLSSPQALNDAVRRLIVEHRYSEACTMASQNAEHIDTETKDIIDTWLALASVTPANAPLN